jgi:hypothetical protein
LSSGSEGGAVALIVAEAKHTWPQPPEKYTIGNPKQDYKVYRNLNKFIKYLPLQN